MNSQIMEEDLPLKLIELSDFLHSPSILSKRLQFKQTKTDNISSEQLIKHKNESTGLHLKDTQSGVVLLKQKTISADDHTREDDSKQKELIVPKDVVVFADDADRKKIGLFQKSNNQFSRHLLITSGDALQALISPLTNAKEWLIVCKLKFSKRYTKQSPAYGNVIISLDMSHPLVRYEILTAFDILQQSFNETKSAYIVIDFSRILTRWFRTYLRRTDQYPSLPHRLLYRYQIQPWKCSVTLGKRQFHQNNDYHRIGNSFKKILYKSDVPMQIHIDFNSLPTNVYSIELNNIFIYSMNNAYKEILKDVGHGLSLVSVHDLYSCEDIKNKLHKNSATMKKEDTFQEKSSIQQQQQQPEEERSSMLSSYEPTEQERLLFEKIWDNRMRIEMQHEQLMMKASRLVSFSSNNNNNNNSLQRKNSDLHPIQCMRY